MDRSSRKKINEETMDLSHMLDQMEARALIDIPHNRSRIHIILNYKWNILQDKPYSKTLKILTNFKRLNLFQASFLTMMISYLKLITKGKLENLQICGN